MSSFDAYVGGFTDYVKQLLQQNPAAFGMAAEAPVYVYDPVLGRIVQKSGGTQSNPMTNVWNAGAPAPPTVNVPPRIQGNMPTVQSPVVTGYGQQTTPLPRNWRETAATRAAYQQSSDLYSGYGGQMGDFAKRLMGDLQTWNQTYNNTGGPQVRAFAPNPMGYDAQGYAVLRDETGQNIYADETDKIAAALKRLSQPTAQATPTYQPSNPDIYGGAGVW